MPHNVTELVNAIVRRLAPHPERIVRRQNVVGAHPERIVRRQDVWIAVPDVLEVAPDPVPPDEGPRQRVELRAPVRLGCRVSHELHERRRARPPQDRGDLRRRRFRAERLLPVPERAVRREQPAYPGRVRLGHVRQVRAPLGGRGQLRGQANLALLALRGARPSPEDGAGLPAAERPAHLEVVAVLRVPFLGLVPMLDARVAAPADLDDHAVEIAQLVPRVGRVAHEARDVPFPKAPGVSERRLALGPAELGQGQEAQVQGVAETDGRPRREPVDAVAEVALEVRADHRDEAVVREDDVEQDLALRDAADAEHAGLPEGQHRHEVPGLAAEVRAERVLGALAHARPVASDRVLADVRHQAPHHVRHRRVLVVLGEDGHQPRPYPSGEARDVVRQPRGHVGVARKRVGSAIARVDEARVGSGHRDPPFVLTPLVHGLEEVRNEHESRVEPVVQHDNPRVVVGRGHQPALHPRTVAPPYGRKCVRHRRVARVFGVCFACVALIKVRLRIFWCQNMRQPSHSPPPQQQGHSTSDADAGEATIARSGPLAMIRLDAVRMAASRPSEAGDPSPRPAMASKRSVKNVRNFDEDEAARPMFGTQVRADRPTMCVSQVGRTTRPEEPSLVVTVTHDTIGGGGTSMWRRNSRASRFGDWQSPRRQISTASADCTAFAAVAKNCVEGFMTHSAIVTGSAATATAAEDTDTRCWKRYTEKAF